MGKPYASELALLAETYNWSMKVDVSPLAEAMSTTASSPLIAVGSGGSLTAAHFVSFLHQRYTRHVAKAITPLEMISSASASRNLSLVFLSAMGRNVDIVDSLKWTLTQEPQRAIVICFNPKSPLSKLARSCRFVDLITPSPPSKKDGFLATNSLLAFSVLMARAYLWATSDGDDLPANLRSLVHPSLVEDEFVKELRERSLPLWQREHLVVIHGTSTSTAALDIESKFTEAALGPVLVADYRNFAHGRHHWLAKRGNSTGVLALVSGCDRQVADKTLSLLPSDIPIMRIDVPWSGVEAGLCALVNALYVVGFAGESRYIDPGRPGVPTFGRKIYNLRAMSKHSASSRAIPPREAVAIERKSMMPVDILAKSGQLDFWRDAYRGFIRRLEMPSFRAIVFDYDGTLCDKHDRYTGVSNDVLSGLTSILRAEVVVGVATGRGKSVRKDLLNKVDKDFWSRVVVGYYNGAEIGTLEEDCYPDPVDIPCEELRVIADALKSDLRLNSISKCTFRRKQITVEPLSLVHEAAAWDAVQHIVYKENKSSIRVLRSSHSIDVIASGVSKRTLVARIEKLVCADQTATVLCIGDRGRWPGNDFELLASACSLSVDEVSPDPATCWNVATAGYRGVQATLEYIGKLVQQPGGSVRFRLERSKGS